MAISLLKVLSNAKTRTLVILTGGIMLAGVIVAIISSGKTGEPLENRASKTSQVPSGVESTPGAKTSEKYRELQDKANTIGAAKAEKKGGTFIPTIVADNKDKKAEDLQSQFLKALTPAPPAVPQDPRLAQILAQQKQDAAAENLLRKQQQAQANAERMTAMNDQRLKAIETVANAMEDQAKAAFTTWNDIPQQTFVEGDSKKDKKNTANNTNNSNNPGVDNRKVVLKSGTILFAVLETSVNSDEPGPIMARIIQPPFKDAKLIGKIELPPENGEKVSLQFDTINIPSEPTSNKISAVAIDPDTARTALATDVDHHYLLRWGSVFGSTFLQGYAKAVAQSGTTVQTATVPGQTTTTTQTPALTGRQQVFEGLGAFGTKLSEQMGPMFSRKPTITIAPGTGIGVLILADVKLGPEPIQPGQVQAGGNNQITTGQKGTNSIDLLNSILQNAGQSNQAQNANANTVNPNNANKPDTTNTNK